MTEENKNHSLRPFHLAFPVYDLEETRKFYKNVMGLAEGRSTDKWIDFNFFGHQISAHVRPDEAKQSAVNEVDGKSVPVRHWGVILQWEQWEALAARLQEGGVEFIIEPYIRFEGEPGEQATMFFLDPSGNALEFKAFKDDSSIFAT